MDYPCPLKDSNHQKVKVTQSCPTLCDPMDCTVHVILQARILEWVAFPFSRGSSQPRDLTQVSCIAGGFFAIIRGHYKMKTSDLEMFVRHTLQHTGTEWLEIKEEDILANN